MRVLFVFILFSFSSWAHQSSINSKFKKLKWPENNVGLTVHTNTSDLSSSTARNLILNSIAEWNAASAVNLSSVTASNNEIKFQSDFSRYGSAVVGVTEVSSKSSGAITSATIRLNDNYEFKSTPGLYSGNQVFLGDVVTHEVGHFLGMAHSEVLDSSMFYSTFPGQSTLSYDDKSGIRTKYDAGFGRIYGYVKGGNSIGVLGAHVQLISRKTGESIGAITNEKGYFDIRGLNTGDTFYLYTSPVKNLDSLPGVYANVQTSYCPGSYIGSFYSSCGSENDGYPQGITLTSSKPTANVGTVTINCELRTSTDYSHEKLQTTFSSFNVYDYSSDQKVEKSFVGYFQNPTTSGWSVPDLLEIDLRTYGNLSGHPKFLKVSLVSQPFGNQLEYQMHFSQNGFSLSGYSKTMTYTSVQTYNTDMEALIPLSSIASENIFEVSLASKKLTSFYVAQTFPSADIFSSGDHLPYLVMMSIWENRSGTMVPVFDSESNLSDNVACLDAPFTFKVASAQVREESGSDAASAAGASCGSIDSSGGDGPNSPGLFVGFALGFLMIALLKRAKNFLS